jgi:hypothetical protein
LSIKALIGSSVEKGQSWLSAAVDFSQNNIKPLFLIHPPPPQRWHWSFQHAHFYFCKSLLLNLNSFHQLVWHRVSNMLSHVVRVCRQRGGGPWARQQPGCSLENTLPLTPWSAGIDTEIQEYRQYSSNDSNIDYIIEANLVRV